MPITTDEQALEVIDLISEVSNTDIITLGTALFNDFGNKIEAYFPGIDDDTKKDYFMSSLNTAGKQIGSISPSDFEELVSLMRDIFALSSDDDATTMLGVVQEIQRTDILGDAQVDNYVSVLKALFP